MKKLNKLLMLCLMAGFGMAQAATTPYTFKQFIGQDTSGERSASIQLSASGACTPGTLNFTSYQAATPGATLRVKLINANANLITTEINLSATTGFTLSANSCLGSVAPNSSCDYLLAYGTGAGAKQFVFTTNGGANTCTVVAN